MSATPELGKCPGDGAGRDAVHVAIAPAVAGTVLLAGSHVGRLADGTFGVTDAPVGIVDPFRTDVVRPGDRFWVCLYPATVTSLRHVWTHPAFVAAPPGGTK